MDKNRIHIDDLVRSRLSGAEEKEPAGAWSSMRDLLDKEMPVETAAFNWRRMLGYATALLLATSVSVGGYNYYRHAINTPVNVTGITGANTSSFTHSSNKAKNETNVVTLAAIAANSNHQAKPESHFTTTTSSSASTTPANVRVVAPGVIQHSADINTGSPSGISGISASASQAGTNSRTPDNQVSTAGLMASSNSLLGKPTGTIASNNELAGKQSENKPAGSAAITTPALNNKGTNKLPQQNAATQALVNSSNTAASTTGSNQPGTSSRSAMPSLQASGSTISANSAANNRNGISAPKMTTTLVKDTIRQIEIAYRRMVSSNNHKLQYQRDTIAITNLVEEKQKTIVMPQQLQQQAAKSSPALGKPAVPAPAKPLITANANSAPAPGYSAPVPQAAAVSNAEAVAATDNIKLVSLSEFRIASRFRKLWNAERFNAMVQNVKADLSRAQFYAGITGGINASVFSATALAGFQAGLTGLLTFNEQWSLAGELKFYQRFNTGKSIQDNYIKQEEWMPGNYTTVNGVQYREWNWKQDTVAHSYNFTTVQTIELPLMLRYNVGRIFAEAGINMMYAFAVNAEEIDKPYGNSTPVSRQMPASFTPESVTGNKPGISASDFNSRFGLGYALGVGYQITPALQANCRLMHSVWDNANSVGGQKVSRNLYQTPSIQFSIGYRFKQGKGR
jgi:hypothetical protein